MRPALRSSPVSPTQTTTPEAVAHRGGDLGGHQGVVLAVVVAPLAVAGEHPGAAGVGELRRRDVAGVGAGIRRVEVLAAERRG